MIIRLSPLNIDDLIEDLLNEAGADLLARRDLLDSDASIPNEREIYHQALKELVYRFEDAHPASFAQWHADRCEL